MVFKNFVRVLMTQIAYRAHDTLDSSRVKAAIRRSHFDSSQDAMTPGWLANRKLSRDRASRDYCRG